MKQAETTNKVAGASERTQPKAVEFLVEAADARMMDSEEGKLAVERGTTEEIRAYGRLMVEEQALLLKQLQQLAGRLGVILPATIGNSKKDGLNELKAMTGQDFDAKFIKMITIDHKRDVREFERAAEFDNPDIKQFAMQYRPMIERHLSGIEAIQARRKAAL